jgi:putative transcriptional regulator
LDKVKFLDRCHDNEDEEKMTFEFKGAGVPGVYLANGYHSSDSEDGRVTSYEDLDGLYFAIGRAIALSDHQLTPGEIKFIRKRLGKSQDEFGRVVGKTNQAVAKWEKGEAPVPVGDGKLMRLAWLAEFDSSQLLEATRQLVRCEDHQRAIAYVFEFDGSQWEPVIQFTTPAWTQAAASDTIAAAMLSSKLSLDETLIATNTFTWTTTAE